MLETLTTDQWISVIALLGALIGGNFAFIQWTSANRTKRAELISPLIEKLRFDDTNAKAMYLVEYEYSWYCREFHNSPEEKDIDKLLSCLTYICYLYKTGSIKKKEFYFFEYEIKRTLCSLDMKRYLWNLYHFSKVTNAPCSFDNLIQYGLRRGLLDNSFIDSRDRGYSKYQLLNF